MSLINLVESYLEEDPLFRERRNKDKGIVDLLINRYGLHFAINRGEITKDRIMAMVQDYASMDRYWRKILEERVELRGTDYDDKDQCEAVKQSELGYNVKMPPARKEVEAVIDDKKVPLL